MAVFGFSRSDYDIVAFTERVPGASEDVLRVVVVLRGGQPQTVRRPTRESRRLNAPWTSAWSNGFDVVRYSRTHGVVSVTEREFEQCSDGRTLVVLADARLPADAAGCIEIANLPAPSMETSGIVSVLWRMLKARVLGGEPYQSPHEQWMKHVTCVPAVQAFLSGAK